MYDSLYEVLDKDSDTATIKLLSKRTVNTDFWLPASSSVNIPTLDQLRFFEINL